MAGSTARSAATHWVVPSAAAAAIHAAALIFGVLGAQPRPAPIEEPPATTEVLLENSELLNTIDAQRPLDEEGSSASTARSARQAAEPPPSELPERAPLKPSHKPERSVAFAPAAPSLGETAMQAQPASTAANTGAVGSAADETHQASNGHAAVSGSHAQVSATAPALKPRLLSSGAVCQGVLGSSLLSAPTKVTLVLSVATDGTAAPTSVSSESGAKLPGLAQAAQRCAQRLRFSPARSKDGAAIAASSVVKLTFSNHYTATLPPLTKPRHGRI
jgi:outer membrane biosynthesis protein TonB